MKKSRGWFGLLGAAIGLGFAVAQLRRARRDKDRLQLANAIVSAALVATEVAIAVRDLKKGKDK